MRSLHFELVNETTPKYETFPISMLDFEHDFAREDITKTSQHMRKLKHEGNIGGNQGSKHFKLLFMEAKNSYQQQRKEMHSLCTPFQPLILGRNSMRSLFNTKTTKMFLKRKMQTHYLNNGHMIVQLIWKNECNLCLDLFIICHKTNS